MLGYTGTYKGQRVSVQGTGMGMPSAGIYAHELINSYNVKKLIRVGTCGSISEKVNVRELVIAQAAATPSSAIRNDFPKYDFPQIASFDLYSNLTKLLKQKALLPMLVTYCQMMFYKDSLDDVFRLGRYGVLAIEMEAAMLYYLAAKFDVEALAIMTVSDSLVTGEETTAEERQTTFNEMIEVGLETAIAN